MLKLNCWETNLLTSDFFTNELLLIDRSNNIRRNVEFIQPYYHFTLHHCNYLNEILLFDTFLKGNFETNVL